MTCVTFSAERHFSLLPGLRWQRYEQVRVVPENEREVPTGKRTHTVGRQPKTVLRPAGVCSGRLTVFALFTGLGPVHRAASLADHGGIWHRSGNQRDTTVEQALRRRRIA